MRDADSGKVEFERGMSSAPPITIALIAANAVIFFITAAQGFLESEAAILKAGALAQDLVMRGEVWRLPSSMFLHGSLEHLAGNAVGLFILGMAAEHAYGKLEMMAVYLLSGLAGALFSTLTNPGPSVGASGAIFGILGLLIVFYLKYHHGIHLRDRRVGNVLLLWAGYSVVTAFFIPFIDNAAHVGGLIAGAFCGYVLTPRLLQGMAVPERTFAFESEKRGRP